MRPIAAAVGFYGKLPCRGDFLRRRVPQEFIDVWDGWLQECINESYRQLEEKWLNAYLTSPVWRFVLTEGACGTGAYAGVMVPSVDRVGRYFPLTIVAQWDVEECALDVACGAQRWFDAAEALAMEAPDTSDLDAFDERVTQLAERVDPGGVAESAHLRELLKHAEFPYRGGQWHVPLAAVGSLQKAVNAIAFRELERTLRPLSLWWTDGSDRADAAWLTLRGLPAASSFAAMLTGEWTANGWNSVEKAGAREGTKARLSAGAHVSAPDSFAAASHGQLIPGSPSAGGPLLDVEDPFASELSPCVTSQSAPYNSHDDGAERLNQADALGFPAPLQLSAHHEPVSRKWDAPPQSVFFVVRPDLGLWGVSTSGVEDARHTAAQTLADVLESVPQAGSLTTLVEEVRRALSGARRQLANGQGAGAADPYGLARTIVFLARGAECSLVAFGEVQAIRCRAASTQLMIGVADFAGDVTLSRARDSESSLLDIVTGTTEPAAIVRYESLQAGDAWLLSGAPLFDEPRLPELARSMPNGALEERSPEAGTVLGAVRAMCSPEQARLNGPLPMLLLAAAPAVGEA